VRKNSAIALAVITLTVVALTTASSPYYQSWRNEQRIKEENAYLMKDSSFDLGRHITKLSDRQRLGLDATPNGKPWPKTAAYLDGYPVEDAKGLSLISIENSSSADIFLKLYRANGEKREASRYLFVPAHERFEMRGISPGEYIVRYLDLSSRKVFQERVLVIEESKSNLGTKISKEHIFIDGSAGLLSSAFEVSPADF
jgi:hypothetical protein